MTLAAGSKIDTSASVMTLVDGAPTPLPLADVFAGKKVVLFSLPGALTPTCTDSQGPEFVAALDDFKAKGVDAVACLTVNDPFVGGVFEKKLNAVGKITFLCDGDASVTKALGIDFDTGGFGGVRAKRGSFIVDDGGALIDWPIFGPVAFRLVLILVTSRLTFFCLTRFFFSVFCLFHMG